MAELRAEAEEIYDPRLSPDHNQDNIELRFEQLALENPLL